MLRNYIKIAFRNFRNNKIWSFINVFSLAFGLGACILIYLFIQDERSFDGIHTKKDQIYRLDEVQSFPGTNTQNVALSMPGMAPALKRDYPEVLDYSRYFGNGRQVLRKDDTQTLIEEMVLVDSSFLAMFDFPLLKGDRATALLAPNSILLTETVATRLLGQQDALGTTIHIGEDQYEVTGILADVSESSHLQFDALVSMSTLISERPTFNTQFGGNFLVTYLLIKDGTDIAALEKKMPEFLMRCMPPDEGSTNVITDFYKLYFQQLEDVHLASMDIEHDYHNYRKFNGSYLGLFSLVGMFILLIAAVNFMNLMTARASHRWKEVGVRKTIGAQRSQMFAQFVVESGLMGVFSFFLGCLLALLALPLLNRLLDRELTLLHFLEHPQLLLGGLAGTLGLSMLAGVYPSYYLSSFKTTDILQGGQTDSGKSLFRSGLVVVQFGLAIGMIISTLIVLQQLNYINNKDIGFDKNHILLVDMNQSSQDVYRPLKEELLRGSSILGVTASGQRLGNNFHQWGFKVRGDSVRSLTPSNVHVDYDYLEVYDMELVSGRGFSQERPRDDGYAFVINEAFAKEMGFEDPIGVEAGHAWYPDDSLGTIIGVVRDFNFNSLHYAINTLSMVVHTDWNYDELSIKVDGNDIPGAIAHAEKTWNSMVPDWPFQYSFLDEHFEELYSSERQMRAVVTSMALLAILIACMGLFGLAAINTEKRMKEVGIRKVLGASVQNIMYHLSKSFALLVIVAFIIVAPLTYWFMQGWLDNFADRIALGPMVFLVGFLLAFLIAICTLSYHTSRAALGNPIEALKDD
ncbi:MAG: ABC transporter permease [Saprospiraceae bacterium]|nr:ABC transporter permease [Saprospiraceae bacterium]